MQKRENRSSRTLLTLTGLLTLSTLQGCAGDSSGIRAACAVFKPISYSSRDTPETQAQVEEHDVKWLRLCER